MRGDVWRRLYWAGHVETIYVIFDRFARPRYVGRTSRKLMERGRQHLYAKTPVGEWLRREGAGARIRRIAQVQWTLAPGRERRTIEVLRGQGHDLLNVWPAR